jgi:hypothetical protein
MLAVAAADRGIGRWLGYARNLVTDFKPAFGEAGQGDVDPRGYGHRQHGCRRAAYSGDSTAGATR